MILWLTADVFDGLAELKDDSVDLIVTSPPFLALRSYLPADHPDKRKEIGAEATPAEFIEVLLRVTAELRRVLAPTGSLCVELGDTYSGSGGAGGDWIEGSGQRVYKRGSEIPDFSAMPPRKGEGWPLAKTKAMIPELYRVALSYGIHPLTGAESTAGQWIVRNVVTWCKPNPPVGRLGDKWRPATSDIVVACTSPDRYWDDLATRKPHVVDPAIRSDLSGRSQHRETSIADSNNWHNKGNPDGAPLLDYWEIIPAGYPGAHYAVYPPSLVEPLIKAMCPWMVCTGCGLALSSSHGDEVRGMRGIRGQQVGDPLLLEDVRQQAYGSKSTDDEGLRHNDERLPSAVSPDASNVQQGRVRHGTSTGDGGTHRSDAGTLGDRSPQERDQRRQPNSEPRTDVQSGSRPSTQTGADTSPLSPLRRVDPDVSQCPSCSSDLRPGRVLDPFAGTGTTVHVADSLGYDAIGIDIDERNKVLFERRQDERPFNNLRQMELGLWIDNHLH